MEFPGNFIGTQNTANTNYLSGAHSLYEVGQGVSDGTWPTNFKINQSWRGDGTSSYMSKALGTADSRYKFTYSGWIKLTKAAATGVVSSVVDEFNRFSFNVTAAGLVDIFDYTSDAVVYRLQSTAVLRDYGSWYHFVYAVDTTQPVRTDRAKLYINGQLETLTETSGTNSDGGFPVLNYNNPYVTSTGTHYIATEIKTYSVYHHGYAAEFHRIDGYTLDASYFGFTHPTTQKWLPKKYTGEYGSTGFHLDFAGTNVGTGAVGTVGEDKSGNGNHFTSTNVASHDVVLDSPTNNFATLNSLDVSTSTLSDGNLKSVLGNAATKSLSTIPLKSGKYFCEVVFTSITGDGCVGITKLPAAFDSHVGYDSESYAYVGNTGGKRNNAGTSSYGNSYGVNDVIGIYFDDGDLYFTKNGVLQNSGTLAFSLGTTNTYAFAFGDNASASSSTLIANFGQDATFGGTKTPTQVYTDANGRGQFFYEPPAGALALCSANLEQAKNTPTEYITDETNKHIITYHDNARVSKFSPYATDGYSVYFNNARIRESSITLGTSDFTITAFVYVSHTSGEQRVIGNADTGSTTEHAILINTSDQYQIWTGSAWAAATDKVKMNTWHRIDMVRSGTSLKFYQDGVETISTTNGNNLSKTYVDIGARNDNASPVNGYFSNLRYVIGDAITPPTSNVLVELSAVTNTALLCFKSRTFVDVSGNNKTLSIATGSPKISDFSPFSPDPNTVTQDLSIAGGSFQFDGLPDKLQVPDSNDWNPGALDFTIEGWYYLTASGSSYYLWGTGGSDGNEDFAMRVNTNNTLGTYLRNSSGTISTLGSTNTVVNNAWNHIALERYNDVIKIYLNGVAESTTFDASSWTGYNSETGFSVGAFGDYTSGLFWYGYIADFRFVKGAAVYQGNFTPPTAPLTQTSKTKLLLQPYSKVKQSGSVYKNIDNYNQDEIGGKLIHNGSQIFDTSPYSKGDDIGSLYFDGVDDELLLPTISPVGTSDFTIEMWFKEVTDSNATYDGFLSLHAGAAPTTHRIQIAVHSGVLHYYNGNWYSTGWTPTTGKWHHVAFVRDYSAPTFKLYVDGTEEYSLTTIVANRDFASDWTGTLMRMGVHTGYNNYLATDVRITKQALYTGAFTAPKYPFTSDKYVTDGTDQSATGPSTTTTYTVTVASGTKYDGTTGNRYVIDGEPFETVTLHRGSTYRFDVSDSSFGSNAHPFRFSSNENNSPSAAYTTGVTTSGDGGSAGAYVEIVVANDAPDNLYYYCTNHSGMGGTIKVEGGRTITTDSVVLHIQPGKKEQKSEVFEFASLIKNNYSGTNITLANNGYSVTSTAAQSVHSSFSVSSGKWYVEASGTGTNGAYVGVQEANTASPAPTYNVTLSNLASQGIGLWPVNGNIFSGNGTSAISAIGAPGTALASTDVVAMAIDMDASPKTVQWLVNNTRVITVKMGSTDYIAADGTTGTATATFADINNLYVTYNGGTTNTRTTDWNFGQDPTILGNVTPSGGTNADNGFPDEDGRGSFRYAPPAGYKAMGRLQKPAQVVSDAGQHPEKYFNTALYTGNGGTQSITGLDFKPDFVWIKSRTSATSHGAYDSVRGPLNALFPDDTSAEVTTGKVSSFDQNGFSLSGAGNENTAGNDYVAWVWRGGDTIVPNTNGTIPSVVSVNQDAGFSIIKYQSSGTAGDTIGHGLSNAPEWIIFKNRDVANGWAIYHVGIGETQKIFLNTTAAKGSTGIFNSTAPTSSVITLGSYGGGGETNGVSPSPGYTLGAGQNYIAYAWHSVPGYSKFGSYEGNANADGPFIYTGFKPAFVLIKDADNTPNWEILDSKRNPINPANERLFPSNSNAVSTAEDTFDFLSNGFKVRDTYNGANNNNATHIYAAFAEVPFTRTSAK